MPYFDLNERVIFTHNGGRQRGKVTKVEPKKRRVVTDSGRRMVVLLRSLKNSAERALILEQRLWDALTRLKPDLSQEILEDT